MWNRAGLLKVHVVPRSTTCACVNRTEKAWNKFAFCIDLHNDEFFGLTLMDRMKLFNETQTNYKKPRKTEIKKNSAHTKGFRERKML